MLLRSSLFHFLAALLTSLVVVVSAPVHADALPQGDASYAADAAHHSAKQVDHASRRPRHGQTASLEEFFEIDDDAEQDFKPVPVVVYLPDASPFAGRAAPDVYRAPPPSHRACASYPTGPPHV